MNILAKIAAIVEPLRILISGARVGTADVITATDAMAAVRAMGKAGELSAGIVKNTVRIPSATGTAAYRIPDELNPTVLGEVKNVATIGYTNQLKDFAAYAAATGRTFVLYVRGSTKLTPELQSLVSSGAIKLVRSLPG